MVGGGLVDVVEGVAHAVALGGEVEAVVDVGGYLYRHIFYNFQAVAFQTYALDGVVGNQTHFVYAQVVQDLCSYAIVAFVGFMAQMQVGVYGVHTLLLKLVGPDFVHQTDASALLQEVNKGASTLLFNHAERLMQLLAAVASERPEAVAGSAGGVHAHKHRLVGSDIALYDGDVLQPVAFLTERDKAEVAVGGRQMHLFTALYERFGAETVGYQVAD